MVIEKEDRQGSPHVERLATTLIAHLQRSGMKKPEFAESIGISGSQFRYLRSRNANPSIQMLAMMAANLKLPLFELLEDQKLGDRRDLSAREMSDHLAVVLQKKIEESGLSKDEFAKIVNISVPQLYIVLRGKANPSLLVLVEIADRLNLRLWQLLGVEPVDVLASAED
jgi:transcriptional regulator with XRE-family HTH domain